MCLDALPAKVYSANTLKRIQLDHGLEVQLLDIYFSSFWAMLGQMFDPRS